MGVEDTRWLFPYDLQWFAKDGEGGEKTEEPTSKKLNDAREEGKVAKSKELNHAFDLIVLFLILKIFISQLYTQFMEVFRYVYQRIPEFTANTVDALNAHTFSLMISQMYVYMLKMVAPFFVIGLGVCLLISVLQVGWKVTKKPLQPKLDKFNPVNGFKRILSKDSLVELLKSIVKIFLIAYVAYTSVKKYQDDLFILYDIPLLQAIILMGSIILDTGLKIAMVYLVIGFSDFFYQKHKFHEDMKMTKQEVKDEYKQTEGSPDVKSKQRQRMQEASRRRMMSDVPKADVVITNPTHLAVAIAYDAEVSSAPVVVAKGEDFIAMKIREVAKENHIEIVENKPLARTLYATVEIGEEIPPELYQAVAEVLAMVYNLNDR